MREAVKCGVRAVLGTLLTGFALTPTVSAQLLFGGGQSAPRPPPELDSKIPRGSLAEAAKRPASGAAPACSFRHPVCVHTESPTGDARALTWLSALDDAYERLAVVGVPPPLSDGARGGSGALDVYLTEAIRDVAVEMDGLDLAAPFDEGAAFCVGSSRELAVERAATLCVAEAAALRLDAAETPFSRRALAEELWLVAGHPTSADVSAVDDVQSHPERAVVARERSELSEGGALLLDFLDGTRGRSSPAAVPLAMYALSASKSPSSWRFTNEPDTLDVFRATFGATPTAVARVFADFTLARAFLGSRDAGGTWPTLAWTSDAGRVRFEWSVPWSSLPRSLAPSRLVEPTGSTYLYLSLDAPTAGQQLIFTSDWESPVAFKWVIAVLDDKGRMLKRIDAPYLERETHVERIVDDLTGAKAVVIAGTNLGGLGPTYPFDPDFEPYEPHGYSVYLAKQ